MNNRSHFWGGKLFGGYLWSNFPNGTTSNWFEIITPIHTSGMREAKKVKAVIRFVFNTMMEGRKYSSWIFKNISNFVSKTSKFTQILLMIYTLWFRVITSLLSKCRLCAVQYLYKSLSAILCVAQTLIRSFVMLKSLAFIKVWNFYFSFKNVKY